ncbi:hypothetical protein LLB_0952 [Legionella longbeachae D-4968]|nr:hypothetical protein LLB_0952 [Legionella longbeachae D-4968]
MVSILRSVDIIYYLMWVRYKKKSYFHIEQILFGTGSSNKWDNVRLAT